MMRSFSSLFGLLIVAVVTMGCIHTPAKVAEETPGVLKNVSDDISHLETPNITLESALQPLRDSVDYVRPIILPTTTVKEN